VAGARFHEAAELLADPLRRPPHHGDLLAATQELVGDGGTEQPGPARYQDQGCQEPSLPIESTGLSSGATLYWTSTTLPSSSMTKWLRATPIDFTPSRSRSRQTS